MTYRPLGDSGLMVSAVGIGCNAFSRRVDLDGVRDLLDAAQDVGVTLLDTADVYGVVPGASEELLGEALQGRREEFVLATKFGMDAHGLPDPAYGARASRRYVRRAVEGSLRRLRTDHIDLYQLHEPDGVTPFEETLAALTELVREGKVRYLGASNLAGWQVAHADWTARTAGLERFVSVQNRYSLLDRSIEEEVVPACEEFGLGILPYFPLEYGLLTGKYRRGAGAPTGSRAELDRARAGWLERADWDRIEALEQYAAARDLDVLDVAIAGLAAQPAVGSVIAGAVSGAQVRRNAAALRWEPTPRTWPSSTSSPPERVRRPAATASTAPSRTRRSPGCPGRRRWWRRRGSRRAACSARPSGGRTACPGRALVVRERVDVAPRERVGGPGVELRRPAGRGRVDAPLGEERQAVGEEAGADDQHALVAQRPQPLAELEQALRVLGGQRHLQHRDVGLGVHDLQRHPGAVVEAAAGVLVDRLGVGHQRRRRARASAEASGRLVGHPVVLRGRTRRSRRPAVRRSR